MKTILLTSLCLFLGLQMQGQSLSVKQLANLLDDDNKTVVLRSHSFLSLGLAESEKGVSQRFTKNAGTGKQEAITITSNSVSYLTRNKAFITNLLAQLQQQYKQTVKDDSSDFIYYLFAAGKGKNISVNISKKGAELYSLQVNQK